MTNTPSKTPKPMSEEGWNGAAEARMRHRVVPPSKTPRTDAADLYDYQTAVETCRTLELELTQMTALANSMLAAGSDNKVRADMAELELVAAQTCHRAWTDAFGTTQLTHALAKCEQAQKSAEQLAAAQEQIAALNELVEYERESTYRKGRSLSAALDRAEKAEAENASLNFELTNARIAELFTTLRIIHERVKAALRPSPGAVEGNDGAR